MLCLFFRRAAILCMLLWPICCSVVMRTIKHGDLPEAALSSNGHFCLSYSAFLRRRLNRRNIGRDGSERDAANESEIPRPRALSHTRACISNNTFATFLTTFIASEIKPAHLLTLIPDQVGPCKRVAMTLSV
jgi:hypothetical protein